MTILKEKIIRYETDGHTVKGFDVGELIRCRECKCWRPCQTDITEHVCHWGGFRKNEDDFCSWAERKEE